MKDLNFVQKKRIRTLALKELTSKYVSNHYGTLLRFFIVGMEKNYLASSLVELGRVTWLNQ